ncbi:MAG: hypothetical protein ABII10_00550, partial [Candidatus Paceibacterota bacterium]
GKRPQETEKRILKEADGAIELLSILTNKGVLKGHQVVEVVESILENWPNLTDLQLLNLRTWSHTRYEEGMRDLEMELKKRLDKALSKKKSQLN